MTESHQVGELAKKVSALTNAEVNFLPNPRIEAVENDLIVDNRCFIELGLKPSYFKGKNVELHKTTKINSSISSGSFQTDGMAIVPASMGTIGRIASGVSSNLIEMAADGLLKENRKLIIVPREAPLSTIHLKNLLALDQAGALILPASPGFYQGQNTVEALVDFVVARILDQLGVEQNLMPPYEV